MAIKIYEKFAPRANPADGDYPHGSIKNESVPGAKDGTPLDADWGNDYAGFDAALLAAAGIVPSGAADTVGNSQRVNAIRRTSGSTVDSVAHMTSLIGLMIGSVVRTGGYHSLGDGGSAEYIVSSGVTADGDVNHSVIGGLTAVLQPTMGAVSARQVGAVPDNVFATRNAVRINKALELYKSVILDGVFKGEGPIVLKSGYTLKGTSSLDSAYYNYAGQKGSEVAGGVGVILPTLTSNSGIPSINYNEISADLLIIPDGDNLQSKEVKISDVRIGVTNRNTGAVCSNNVYATYVNHGEFSNIMCQGAAVTSWHSHITWSSTFDNVFLSGLNEANIGYPTGTGFSFGLGVTTSGMTSNKFNSCGTFKQSNGWFINRGFYSELSSCFAEDTPINGLGFSIVDPFGVKMTACGSENSAGKMVKVEATTGNSQTITIDEWSAVGTIISGETFEFRGAGLRATLHNAQILPVNPINSIGTYGGEVSVTGNIPFKTSSDGSTSPIDFGMSRTFYKHNRTTATLEFNMTAKFLPFYVGGVAQFFMLVDFTANADVSSPSLATVTQTLSITSQYFISVSKATVPAAGYANVSSRYSGRVNKNDSLSVTLSPGTLQCSDDAGQVMVIRI